MSSKAKKILKIVLIILLVLVLIVGGYFAYVMIAYHRIEDKQVLEINDTIGNTAQADEEYKVISYNIGFAAYTPDFGFFMDGGKESRANSEESVKNVISGIGDFLKKEDADFLFIEEVDKDATRSYHYDEESALRKTLTGYDSVFTVNYDSPYLFYPVTKPHGKSYAGMMTLSKYNIQSKMKNGLLIFSAPSGSGKSTIVNWLMKEHPELKLAFSISCTSRAPRGTEQNGVEYFFLTPEEFKAKIEADEFLEYEEVYQDRFYGTLKSQVENQLEAGDSVVFDVDVKGGVNIKKFYGGRALSIFVQPPSVEELRRRLNGRGTDAPEVIEQRLAKANYELTFAPQFDHIVVNDNLEKAEQEVYKLVSDFLNQE